MRLRVPYAFGNATIPSTAFAIAVALVVVFDRWTPTASLGADSAAGRRTLQLDAVGHKQIQLLA